MHVEPTYPPKRMREEGRLRRDDTDMLGLPNHIRCLTRPELGLRLRDLVAEGWPVGAERQA